MTGFIRQENSFRRKKLYLVLFSNPYYGLDRKIEQQENIDSRNQQSVFVTLYYIISTLYNEMILVWRTCPFFFWIKCLLFLPTPSKLIYLKKSF